MHLVSPIPSSISIVQPAPPSTPAFLARFPRSLSSLSLGTKKKPNDKENVTTPIITSSNTNFHTADTIQSSIPAVSHHHAPQQQHQSTTPVIKKNINSNQSKEPRPMDIPPPLPQRNMPRKSSDGSISSAGSGGGSASSNTASDIIGGDVNLRRNTQISDLDHSNQLPMSPSSGNLKNNNTPVSNKNSSTSSSSGGKGKQRTKQQKIKAHSDPKMSSQTFIDMEQAIASNDKIPPPLPPRQPGMLEEKQNVINNNKFNYSGSPRPPPNSLESHLSYPLIATCTAVRDNLSAFPLSHRPNIVQQLQQQQQQQLHPGYNNQHHSSPSSTSCTTTTTSTTTSNAAVLSKSTVSNPIVSQPPTIHKHTHTDFYQKHKSLSISTNSTITMPIRKHLF